MSTRIVGFIPPDETFKKMKAAYDSCIAIGAPIPEIVLRFFNYNDPEDTGLEVELGKIAEHWTDGDMCEGVQIELAKIPPGVKIIRFYNSF